MRKFSKQKHYYIKHKYRIYRFIDLKEIYLFIFGYKSVIKKSNYFQKKNQKKLEDLYIKQKAAYLIIFGHLGFFTFFFLSGLIIKYPLLIIIFPFFNKSLYTLLR